MTSIDHVRGLLRDRQTKDGARGTIEEVFCLDVELIDQLEALEADLVVVQRQQQTDRETEGPDRPTRKRRLSDSAPPEDDDLEDGVDVVEARALVAAKEDEIRAASLRLVFRSVGSTAYQAIVNRHPQADEDSEGRAGFLDDVLGTCLKEVWTLDGELLDGLGWDELREPLGFGEWEQAAMRVTALNRRKVDVPFSLRSSKPTRG